MRQCHDDSVSAVISEEGRITLGKEDRASSLDFQRSSLKNVVKLTPGVREVLLSLKLPVLTMRAEMLLSLHRLGKVAGVVVLKHVSKFLDMPLIKRWDLIPFPFTCNE